MFNIFSYWNIIWELERFYHQNITWVNISVDNLLVNVVIHSIQQINDYLDNCLFSHWVLLIQNIYKWAPRTIFNQKNIVTRHFYIIQMHNANVESFQYFDFLWYSFFTILDLKRRLTFEWPIMLINQQFYFLEWIRPLFAICQSLALNIYCILQFLLYYRWHKALIPIWDL